ncbi:MAG: hypothetical protein M0R80_03830 [Proteobacteria bacterium]|jgi:predicted  nucleic acid-binding Zn-ribbon protein|nr:hypothetical protein [Pseudomonadota bacterium]
MPTNQEIKEIYAKKGATKKSLHKINEDVLTAQADLKKLRARIINTTDKKKLGTNDKEREAYIIDQTLAEVLALESLEAKKRSLDLEYSLVSDEIECLQWQIRNEQAAADCEAQRLGVI